VKGDTASYDIIGHVKGDTASYDIIRIHLLRPWRMACGSFRARGEGRAFCVSFYALEILKKTMHKNASPGRDMVAVFQAGRIAQEVIPALNLCTIHGQLKARI
jgi:hypothetical protein